MDPTETSIEEIKPLVKERLDIELGDQSIILAPFGKLPSSEIL